MNESTAPHVLILDAATRAAVGRCTGPATDGSCPRVHIGDVVPCAGCALVPEAAPNAEVYLVSGQMTLCPVTLARALAVPTDSPLVAA